MLYGCRIVGVFRDEYEIAEDGFALSAALAAAQGWMTFPSREAAVAWGEAAIQAQRQGAFAKPWEAYRPEDFPAVLRYE